MTTVLDANVHNLAVEGTFDDCQVSPLEPSLPAVVLISAGHRESAFCRQRPQSYASLGCSEQHQLGTNTRADRLLLPCIFFAGSPDRERPPRNLFLRSTELEAPIPQTCKENHVERVWLLQQWKVDECSSGN